MGVKKGDRVAISLGNNIEYAIVWELSIIEEFKADKLKGDV